MKIAIYIFFLILISSTAVSSQIVFPDQEIQNREARMRESNASRKLETRIPLPKLKAYYRNKLTKEQKERLKPSAADLKEHSNFLKNSKNGIVKIFPNPQCSRMLVSVADSKCIEALPILGNGSIYSFYARSHFAANKFHRYPESNLSFSEDKFSVQFRDNLLGFITSLKTSDLNSATAETKEIKALLNLTPVQKYSESVLRLYEFNQKKTAEGQPYATEIAAKLNGVYAMRTINYYALVSLGSIYFYRDDLTLVFQVISRDSDGALTLIWKEFDRKSRVRIPN